MTSRQRGIGLPFVIAIVVAVLGCNPAGPSSNCTVAVYAVVENLQYRGCQDNAINSGGNISVASSGNNTVNTFDLNFGAAATVGTTQIGAGSATSFQIENAAGGVWIANQFQGSGSLTIATVSATGATGSFQFTATASSGGATGNMVVTGGTFTVTF